jgi:magnesium transporter
MISRYSYQDVTWVDIQSPNKDEIIHIIEEFSLPTIIGDEAIANTLHSKVDLYENLIYMILHFPPSNKDEEKATDQEIDFIISKNFIITVHYEKIYSLEQFKKTFESLNSSSHNNSLKHGELIFIEMMKELYRHTLHKIESVTEVLQKIESNLFKGNEESMVQTISLTSRRLLDFKRALHFHEDILKSYENASKEIFGNKYIHQSSIITSEFNKVKSLLDSNRDTIVDLQRTNDSLLSTKQNSIMKKFTILSFVTFPLMLVTGIFGMNVGSNLLFIQSNADFFFVLGAMIMVSVVMFIYFKFHKWL